MFTHYILLSSNYTDGKRKALEYIVLTEIEQKNIEKVLDKILYECGEDVSISTHCVKPIHQIGNLLLKKIIFLKMLK